MLSTLTKAAVATKATEPLLVVKINGEEFALTDIWRGPAGDTRQRLNKYYTQAFFARPWDVHSSPLWGLITALERWVGEENVSIADRVMNPSEDVVS